MIFDMYTIKGEVALGNNRIKSTSSQYIIANMFNFIIHLNNCTIYYKTKNE
ncbi:hypothetical protein DEU42_102158 [Flavobacterium sp. AG291]|nr:hypothetical protein DEU42_102158 [Flavobacterium sp. AG291]